MDTLESATKENKRPVRNRVAKWLACLIVLVVVAFVTWRVFLAIEIGNHLKKLAAAHLPANGAELDKWYPAVAPEQNAGLALTNVFELVKKLPDKNSDGRLFSLKLAHNHPMSADDTKLAYQYVEQNRLALDTAADALTRLRASRYPVDLSAGVNTPLPHLAHLKSVAMLADFAARRAIDSGDVSTAIESWKIIFGLARTLDTEPTLISQLVRIAIVRIGVHSLEFGLSNQPLNATQIDQMQTCLRSVERTNQMAFALIGERAIMAQAFRQEIFNNWSPEDPEKALKPAGRKANGFERGMIFASGFFERDLSFYLDTMETALPICEQAPPVNFSAERVFLKSAKTATLRGYFLSSMILPVYSKLLTKDAESLAELTLSRMALSIESYRIAKGRLPQDADEVKAGNIPNDPFSQSPLHYKTLQKGFVVYSVGPDRIDDEAKEKPTNRVEDGWDITFFVDR